MYQRERGTCFSRRFGRWEPGPVGGMGVGFGEGGLARLFGGVSIFSARECLRFYWRAVAFVVAHPRAFLRRLRVAGVFFAAVLSLCLLRFRVYYDTVGPCGAVQ